MHDSDHNPDLNPNPNPNSNTNTYSNPNPKPIEAPNPIRLLVRNGGYETPCYEKVSVRNV